MFFTKNSTTEGAMTQLLDHPVSWQGAMGIILKPVLSKMGLSLNIGDLCETLGIGRTSAYEAKKHIEEKLFQPPQDQKKENELERDLKIEKNKVACKEFEIEVLKYKIDHPDCYVDGQRPFYSEEYKEFILELKVKYGFTFEKISPIVAIPLDTLKKFPKAIDSKAPGDAPKELPQNVVKLINIFLRSKGKKTVKNFVKKNSGIEEELGMNYRQILSWLRRLGFVSTQGIFIPNKGLDRIIRFSPNAVWGSDGKQMNIIINGVKFKWVWQCLIDYKTTVIVGGFIGQEETTQNLLEAIKDSKEKTGVVPLGIVIDNKLSENLPPIREFLDKYGIEIVKIFPGNAKSNGILEGNFNIFERWVGGKVVIQGDDPEALSRSIAQMLVEIFTRLRNHYPRKIISYKTPEETLKEAEDNPPTPKETQRMKEKIKELADRLKKEQKITEISTRKQTAIDVAVQTVRPKDEDTFRKSLSHYNYPHYLILQAIAIFSTRCQLYPENNYDHTYFGGILRNLVNDRYIEKLNTNLNDVFYHDFEELLHKNETDLIQEIKADPVKTVHALVVDYLKMPVPAWGNAILLQMKELFLLVAKGSAKTAKSLCDNLTKAIAKMTYENSKKRETLLCRLYEWVNYVQTYDKA
jgi:hypothetical protein